MTVFYGLCCWLGLLAAFIAGFMFRGAVDRKPEPDAGFCASDADIQECARILVGEPLPVDEPARNDEVWRRADLVCAMLKGYEL